MNRYPFLRRLTLAILVCLFTLPPLAVAQAEPAENPASSKPDDGKLTVTATLLMPDGSPAAGAVLQSTRPEIGSPAEARADEKGRVQLRGVFGNGAQLHASTADGQHQAILHVTANATRTTFTTPVELKLAPAQPKEIVVISNGEPVSDAEVFVEGTGFRVHGVTGPDGAVTLHLPAGRAASSVVAWHPTLGVAGDRDLDKPLTINSPLSLHPPAPLTVRFIDTEGDPVVNIKFGMSAKHEDADWMLISHGIESAQATSDERGEAVIGWAPKAKLQYVDVTLYSDQWKTDDTDLESIADRLVVIHLRKKTPVEGRLVIPDGASPEGILITGFAFGPHSTGDIPYARARRDGTFTLPVASAHGYVLGVCDQQFASARYPSVILPADGEQPEKLTIEAYPATPLTVRVTRGPDREPAPEAWVHLSSDGEVEYIEGTGEKTTGRAGVQQWLLTDSNGEASAGVGLGELEVRLASGDWTEERTIKVNGDEPVEVEFHRDWQGQRQLAMRLTQDGEPYQPSSTAVALAWSERPSQTAKPHAPKIAEDGTVNVAFDATNLALLVIDRDRYLSGYARFAAEEPPADLKMLPMATYRGTIRQQSDQPFAGREVQLQSESSWLDVAAVLKTDPTGRFEFSGVPVEVPLDLRVKNDPGVEEFYLSGNRKVFAPGETRDDDDLRALRRDEQDEPKPDLTPLSERLASFRRNSEVTGMPILVVLPGDDSANANVLVGAVLNGDDDVIYGYLPIKLAATPTKADAATLEEYGWPRPAADEVVLVVLDSSGKASDHARISLASSRAATQQGSEFLKRHLPTTEDAREMLAAAQEEAQRDDRRIWLIAGGPRCGPCFALARWVDEHRDVLEKDYVILKVMTGVDHRAAEVIGQFREQNDGIPWHAIIDSGGTLLTTSDGPLGNIGMPSSVEGLRHFRKMLKNTSRHMSVADIDGLIESLSPEE